MFHLDPAWHMILGGVENQSISQSVELFNWQTGEQCFLENLPEKVRGHAGTVFEGIPMFCGGWNASIKPQELCYQYNNVTKRWEMVGYSLNFININYANMFFYKFI
jgi:hypothetical protein